MTYRMLLLLFVSLIFFVPSLAAAESVHESHRADEAASEHELDTPTDRPQLPPGHTWSFTINPVSLLGLVVDLSAEYRLHDQIGLVARGGVGLGYLFGVQGNYYIIRDFDHGLHVGALALFIADLNGRDLMTGGYVGYKFAAHMGATVSLQVGAGYRYELDRPEDYIVPLLQLNLGWSF